MEKLSGRDTRQVVARELSGFLQSQVQGEGPAIEASTPLRDIGLDSFAIMELLLFIEKRFAVKVPLGQLTSENLHSIDSLSLCVDSLLCS